MNCKRLRRTDMSGYSLIELLVVLVVLGIIMAITVSMLLSARDKSRQGATIADMRNIATAIEAYAVDHALPPPSANFPDVAKLLEPYHSQKVPTLDHWGHLYSYVRADPAGYSLTSTGKDGIPGQPITKSTRFEFDRDIVIADGRFPGL